MSVYTYILKEWYIHMYLTQPQRYLQQPCMNFKTGDTGFYVLCAPSTAPRHLRPVICAQAKCAPRQLRPSQLRPTLKYGCVQ
jgi:hypothetical protein